MEFPMNFLQPRLVDMRVNLGGGQTRMPQHLLNCAQVRTMTEQMRGKGMP